MKLCKKCGGVERYESNGKCIACRVAYNAANRERAAAYRAANRERDAAYSAAHRATNRERYAARNAAWAKANPVKRLRINTRYRFNRNAELRLAVGAAAITLLTDYLEGTTRG